MTRALTRVLLLVCVVGLPLSSQAEIFVEGEDYQRLPIAVQTSAASKVEVVEVFSYASIHCFSFEPMLAAWMAAMPEDVMFARLPAIFNEEWALLAQVFYTAEVLGVTNKVHTAIFDGIHVERVDLLGPSRLAELFQREADIPPEQFIEVLNSFSARSRVQQANARGRAYRIKGVPTMVVAGKYWVDGSMAGNYERMLEVVGHLVEIERAAMLGEQLSEPAE